jgi:hypothetical protein
MSGTEGLGRTEQSGADFAAQSGSDDEVRAIFVRLITFVASAKASHDAKNDALRCIEVLQARMLP